VDRPSVGIPFLFVHLGYILSDAQRAQGKTGESSVTLKRAYFVARAAHLDSQVPMPDTLERRALPVGDSALRKQIPVTKSAPVKVPKPPSSQPPTKRPE
jgi:hypothetical protein